MIVDIERIVSDYLRTYPDVVSLGTRIAGKAPNNTDTSWVQVRRLDGPAVPGSPVDHLIDFMLQFDCYAGKTGGQPEANTLGRTVRAALDSMNGSTVVSGVRMTGDIRLPDPYLKDAEGDARERVVLTASVFAHA